MIIVETAFCFGYINDSYYSDADSTSFPFASRPIVGWGPSNPGRAHLIKRYANGELIFDQIATIDENLIRMTEAASGSAPIAFFGDSFVYGEGLNDGNTLPQIFSDLLERKIPILNISMSGYSPAQSLAALKAGIYDRFLQHPRHIILVTSSFHVQRTSCRVEFSDRAPKFLYKNGALIQDGFCQGDGIGLVFHNFVKRFATYQSVYMPFRSMPNQYDIIVYKKIIEQIAVIVKEKYGAEMTLIFIPGGFKDENVFAMLQSDAYSAIYDVQPTVSNPKIDRIPGDGHPTRYANQVRAKELFDYMLKTNSSTIDH